ncbi:MAG TPA: glycerol-3-phosphate acyltransferase [Candidatus Cloacimonetes bacterium]|nr:glycerol-3-phosphate acyltransferase [Candidatus Cloacimonadota bacterium]HEX37824.1 glycerol-3-phosphate acyltransferase [Candidatus Cloacimonadota bacterium]
MSTELIKVFFLSIVGYLYGSLSFSLIVTKILTGKDIRNIDFKNAGAYNVYKNIGKGWGSLVAVLDGLKGYVIVIIGFLINMNPSHVIIAASFVIIGHCFPVFYNFYGGRGGAPIIGVLLPFIPLQLLIGLIPAVIISLIIRKFGTFPAFWLLFVFIEILLLNIDNLSSKTINALLYVMLLTGVLNTIIIMTNRDTRVVKE